MGHFTSSAPGVLSRALRGRYCQDLRLTHKETEAQRGDVACPRSHSGQWQESVALVSLVSVYLFCKQQPEPGQWCA